MSVVGAQCIIPLASRLYPPSLLNAIHPLSLLSSSSGASAIGKENKNKKPKEKPKQNASPSANVSQSLNSHHTPSSATKKLFRLISLTTKHPCVPNPTPFAKTSTPLKLEAGSTRSAQARGRSGQPQVDPTGPFDATRLDGTCLEYLDTYL